MTNLYGGQHTYINNITSLTAPQFEDKVDLFYNHVVTDDRITALNIFTDGNTELEVHIAASVPDGEDAQAYFSTTIEQIIKDALSRATLSVTSKVAARIEEPVAA
ncbi:hypothetical protein C5C03_04025 [Clavibacter michiganensis]|uniref:hypothetical protein n=1 Tax=Clavibacter michiganensis TaxID=28447 RepID=UPI000CE83251|nr:hypothetical protein [Clavibacter michiganensis]PPF89265.1 hypothetical protein C5C03_04025 [Clavibacter michiganensis]PPF97305.1 hypothetical protein C5C05_05410 [Clavibacter michiganensis]